MKDKHITSPKHMNTAKKVQGRPGPNKGMVTDGTDLKKGFKTVKPNHIQKGAYSSHNKSDNMKHHY
jgi:hypothetical protein